MTSHTLAHVSAPLASATTPDGREVTLTREAGYLVVRVDRVPLMSDAVHGSEAIMAEQGCEDLAHHRGARVLVGGLGLGFALRAVLDTLDNDSEVDVVELLPTVVAWHRAADGPLGPLADRPLDDPRVTVIETDLRKHLLSGPSAYDAILLDVDNGPEALTTASNAWFYGRHGLNAMRDLLLPGGKLVVWSAFASPRFAARMEKCGFTTQSVTVRARGHANKGAKHALFVGSVGGLE